MPLPLWGIPTEGPHPVSATEPKTTAVFGFDETRGHWLIQAREQEAKRTQTDWHWASNISDSSRPTTLLDAIGPLMKDFFKQLFHKPSDQNVDPFYAVVEKYGYGQVPSAEVYAVFEEIASPALVNFSIIKPGTFARQTTADIVHIVGLQARKGGAYTVCWGVSLPFQPLVCGGRLRRHRTLKAARMDLWEDPFEYFATQGNYIAQNGHGTPYLRETMTAMWSATNAPIQSWFNAAGDLAAILIKAEEQQKRKWQGPRHAPEPQLVRAFILRRLGRDAEARVVLEEYIAHDGISPTDAELLRAALNG